LRPGNVAWREAVRCSGIDCDQIITLLRALIRRFGRRGRNTGAQRRVDAKRARSHKNIATACLHLVTPPCQYPEPADRAVIRLLPNSDSIAHPGQCARTSSVATRSCESETPIDTDSIKLVAIFAAGHQAASCRNCATHTCRPLLRLGPVPKRIATRCPYVCF